MVGYGGEDLSLWPTLALAFKTLGVVYGDMGTNPLYVFADVYSKVLKGSDDDVLGVLSLIMYANVNLLPNRQQADEQISSYKLKIPTPELKWALKIKETLERTSFLKSELLVLVHIGTSMIIEDGILTPAISGAYK
ncbi:potassium transporter 12-like protein [Trifolium pratense]|uniref:Potassium transporter 12-like protein n=1 Tax=Trifolium pratense TaxID=57577 RepID=A0A2K3LEZ7_TRIPR|nr:potassium transporter 12-like protein [Trifolium pratense]